MTLRSWILTAVLTTLVSQVTVGQEKAKAPRDHKLPADPKAVVLEMRYQGGFTPPRKNNDADLTIRADGTVILGAPFGSRKRIETKVSQKELQALLRFVLDEQQLSKFDEAQAKKDVLAEQKKRGGLAIAVADAATTAIRVQADGKTHEAKYYALGMAARQYPQVKSLSRLLAVQNRLNRFRGEIYAGGEKGVAQLLQLANAELKAKHPNVKPFTAEDLQSAWQLANGNTSANFVREEPAGAKQKRYTSASISREVNGNVKVNANSRVVPQR